MGRLQEALAAHEQEEQFDRAGGDAASLGAGLLNQSITFRLLADFTGAVKALERSCKANELAGDLAGLQRAQHELALAKVERAKGEFMSELGKIDSVASRHYGVKDDLSATARTVETKVAEGDELIRRGSAQDAVRLLEAAVTLGKGPLGACSI